MDEEEPFRGLLRPYVEGRLYVLPKPNPNDEGNSTTLQKEDWVGEHPDDEDSDE